jgi:hypothetical protein
MQTLGLADTNERSDSRLKSLFWPSVQSGADVDYLGAQGYWVCTFIAVSSFGFSLLQGKPVLAVALLLFFYVGGIGVRERDLFAAAIVFTFYAIDTLISVTFLAVSSPWGMIVFRVFVTALLLSNIRATWIASKWRTDSEEAALPPRLGETWSDKFADQLPAKVWPKARIAYYIFGMCVLTLVSIGLASMFANVVIRHMG